MFYLTKAGRNAIFNNKSLSLDFSTMQFGSGRYTSKDNDTRTNIQTVVATAPLSVKSVGNGQLQLTCTIKTTTSQAVYEAGVFNNAGQLIAIKSSSSTPLFTTTANLNHSVTFTVTI